MKNKRFINKNEIHLHSPTEIIKKLKRYLNRNKITNKLIIDWSQDCDAVINLGGRYDGIIIEVGIGYYQVGKYISYQANPEFLFMRVDGNGEILKELEDVFVTLP
jgi:hypothetical protein